MPRWRRPAAAVGEARVLADGDVAEALAVCARVPVDATLAAARLVVAARTGLVRAGGQAWGYPAQGPLEAVCWAGANLVPVVPATLAPGDRRAAAAAFAGLARRAGRRSSSIVGERSAVLALWERLAEHWPAPREVRATQPSLAIDREPDVAPDPHVRRSRTDELDIVLPACVRMFTEEVGYSPTEGGGRGYEDRVRSLVATGRSFVRVGGARGPGGDPPHVVFKAELGAVTPDVVQVQGVWVDPRYRGRGLSGPGMAAVVHLARGGGAGAGPAPVVSLYVNDYNTRALATYRRVGFEQVGTYTTVLF